MKRILQLCLSMLISAQAFASSPGTSIFPFLKICPSARDSSMGEISSLSASGTPQSNPAVLPWQKQNEVSLNHLIYFQDTNYSYLNYNHMLKSSMAFNASLGYIGIGGLTKTVADSSFEGFSEIGSFDYYDMLAGIGFGHKVSDIFSYGVSARYAQEVIDSNTDSGIMMSFGGYFGKLPENWKIGFGIFNLGPQVKGYDLPTGAYAGFGKQFNPRFFGSGEFVAYLDNVNEARIGVEYLLTKALTLRGGYRYPLKDNELGDFPYVNITAGIGFVFKDFSLDYAWVPYGDLGQTHRLGFSKKFGSVKADNIETQKTYAYPESELFNRRYNE